MKIIKVKQGDSTFLQTTKKVNWLVENTTVSVFDPLKFEGYQREINENHCKKIVDYLEKSFYLPTPIICACDNDFEENTKLRIVDGQHRIQALKKIKEEHPGRFGEIKDFEIPIIVMEKVDMNAEIDTFITINKTSKRVDTSLAYILKNKLNSRRDSRNLTISKLDYISVELAVLINKENFLWKDRISFNSSPSKNGTETLSLNAFVKATRRLVGQLEKKGVVEIEWKNEEEIKKCKNAMAVIFDTLWGAVEKKWPELFKKDQNQLKIIQGPIGYSSITRYIANEIKNIDDVPCNYSHYVNNIAKWIENVTLDEKVWYPGNSFSKLSSESGYNIIASELKKSKIDNPNPY